MPRSSAFYLGLTLIGLLFLYRLFQVQVINEDYATRAERNATAAEKLYAPRGYVYDRDGRLLVGNSPAYDLMVSPYLIKDLDTTALGHLLDLEVSVIKEQLEKAKNYSYFRSSMFMKMLSKSTSVFLLGILASCKRTGNHIGVILEQLISLVNTLQSLVWETN